jgi:hypothetical protein
MVLCLFFPNAGDKMAGSGGGQVHKGPGIQADPEDQRHNGEKGANFPGIQVF